MFPAFPANDSERLEALHRYNVLDTAPEGAFDDITQVASAVCQTPVSLISFVDTDRQWFKSRCGFTIGETPRRISFCAYSILQPELFLIPDTLADARFADNPLVTDSPRIRFYAGAPLITPDGFALGTLCVIDYVPRELNRTQQNALRALSRQVVSQLELRRTLTEREQMQLDLKQAHDTLEGRVQRRTAELQHSRAQMQAILDNTPSVVYVKDHAGQYRLVNRAFEKLFGLEREQILGKTDHDIVPAEMADAYQVNDREVLEREVALEREEILVQEGETSTFLSVKFPLRDPANAIYGLCGISTDISDRVRAEQEKARRLEREQYIADWQRAFLSEILLSVTEGKLQLISSEEEITALADSTRSSVPVALFAESLHDLRQRVCELGEQLGFSTERIWDLVTAVSEVAMNAVVHGHGGEARIAMVTPDSIRVCIEDRGQGISLDSLHRATLQKGYSTAGTMGYGWWMTLKMVDRVWLRTGPGGTTVVLEQQREMPPPPVPLLTDPL